MKDRVRTLVAFVASAALMFGQASADAAHACPNGFLANEALYSSHCERESGPSGSDPNWPCFHHSRGNSQGLQGFTTAGGSKTCNSLVPKNDDFVDFTMKDPTIPFAIEYRSGFVLNYLPERGNTGCYTLRLDPSTWSDDDFVQVEDENGNNNILVGPGNPSASARICTKWVHISA